MPSNRAASVAVIQTWPRPSRRLNRAVRRIGSRCAATSSSSRIGGAPRRSATSSAWARTRPSRAPSARRSRIGRRASAWRGAGRRGPGGAGLRSLVRLQRRASGWREEPLRGRRPASLRARSGAGEGIVGRKRRAARRAPRRCARGLPRSRRHARPSQSSSAVSQVWSAALRRRAACCARASPPRSATMVRMAGLERQHQPVEKAAAVARAAGEQPVHRRGQPQDRQPFAERVHRCRGAVDANPATFGSAGERPRADFASPIFAATPKPPGPPLPGHLGERCAAKTAARGEQRDGFEQVGLAGAVLAREQHEARAGLDRRLGIGTEVGQGQPADGHRYSPSAEPARSNPRRRTCRAKARRPSGVAVLRQLRSPGSDAGSA